MTTGRRILKVEVSRQRQGLRLDLGGNAVNMTLLPPLLDQRQFS